MGAARIESPDMLSVGKSQTQIPFGNDRKMQRPKQIPFGNDNKKGKLVVHTSEPREPPIMHFRTAMLANCLILTTPTSDGPRIQLRYPHHRNLAINIVSI